MYIIFEYQVITEDLTCMIDKVLGVFCDFDIARDFYLNEVVKRGLDPDKLLQKRIGDRGLFFFSEDNQTCLFTDLNIIEQVYQMRMKKYEESQTQNEEQYNEH